MSTTLIPTPTTTPSTTIHYPESDGAPVANNTKHYELIATTKYGLERAFLNRDDVFVAADLFWYPVEGNPKIAVAPDVMVAFGRPPGARPSYKQWEEDNIPFHVVFEFLSPVNTTKEMVKKAFFFDHYGVEEYYVYDIDTGDLQGFVRYGGKLEEIETDMRGWISPRLGIRFEVEQIEGEPELVLYYADGARFLSYLEIAETLETVQSELSEAKSELSETKSELNETKHKLSSLEQESAGKDARIQALEEHLRRLGLDAAALE